MPNKLAEFGGELCDCCAGGAGTCVYVSCCPLCAYAETTAEADVGGGCFVECCLAYWLPCMIPIRMGQYGRAVKTAKKQGLLGSGGIVLQKQAAPQQQQDMNRQSIPMAQVVYDPPKQYENGEGDMIRI
ncbi:hypothetical protein BASA82_000295 [Batrachochytrium salamandrivorans]|nr:hypothetical protein BASA81_002735 [Batrachochytrium salamandrivorans]KAH9262673.1 hypothetical protein BASA82_000295 [Batrachochytrium salamandrivorans]